MKNIEREGQLIYLDQLIENILRLVYKVESSKKGRLEYYKCSLVVPLSMDIGQFIQELIDWGTWNLDLKPTKTTYFTSRIIIQNLEYVRETRDVYLTFTFPKEYKEQEAEFSNSFLNMKFKNLESWKNRINSYQDSILSLNEKSEDYFKNPEVLTDIPKATDYLSELLK